MRIMSVTIVMAYVRRDPGPKNYLKKKSPKNSNNFSKKKNQKKSHKQLKKNPKTDYSGVVNEQPCLHLDFLSRYLESIATSKVA